MSKFFSLFIVLLASVAYSQNFTWVKGTSSVYVSGIYGTLGVGNAANCPGSREEPAQWTDAAGNLWLFGGQGSDYQGNTGYLSDLWKYSPSSNTWTWINGSNVVQQSGNYGTLGIPSATTNPGAREGAASWFDGNGNLWLFGGDGLGQTAVQGMLNDLWKYNISSGQWTWMSGPNVVWQNANYGTQGVPAQANIPGARFQSGSWFFGGSLFLFGGEGLFSSGNTPSFLNDLWKYDISSGLWTWIKGSNQYDQHTVLGTTGVPSPTIGPGARSGPGTVVDPSGVFWLFGGEGDDASPGAVGPLGALNDLWKYDPATGNWTYMGGAGTVYPPGIYGQIGVFNPLNTPDGRSDHAMWIDAAGRLWLFGGIGVDSQSTYLLLNDLWQYDPSTNSWAWMLGSNIIDALGMYGTQGISAPGNMPGARQLSSYWVDAASNLWIFGGFGVSLNSTGWLNDLWKYSNCNLAPSISSSQPVICSGKQATLTAQGAGTYTWNNGQQGSSVQVSPTVTTTYTVYTTNGNGCMNQGAYTQSVFPLQLITAGSSSPSLCSGQQATLSALGGSSYTWSTGGQGSTLQITPTVTGVYTVFSTDGNGCISQVAYTQMVSPLPPVTATSNPSVLCTGQYAALLASGAASYTWNGSSAAATITVSPGTPGTAVYTVVATSTASCVNEATVAIIVNDCTGLDESVPDEDRLQVYPNPNPGEFVINSSKTSDLVLVDQLGRLVQRIVLPAKNGSQIKVTGLRSGIYFLNDLAGKQQTPLKIVVN